MPRALAVRLSCTSHRHCHQLMPHNIPTPGLESKLPKQIASLDLERLSIGII